MAWSQIERLYDSQIRHGTTLGLTLTYKLTYDHINLNTFSKMRVNLAAQTLSSTVANALKATGQKDTEELQEFILLIDKFFDIMNVRDNEQWRHKRKVNLMPIQRGISKSS